MNSKVDDFIENAKSWEKEYKKLRRILTKTPLNEEFKWSKPCYSYDGSNVVIIQGFKNYVALMFFKGSLLKDPKKILQDIGPNSRVGKQIRFTDSRQIGEMESVIKDYITLAIEVEKSGKKVAPTPKDKIDLIPELKKKMKEDPDFKKAFLALTPGRQRGYNIFFSQAKQSKTRESRIEKSTPKILNGKGFNER